MGTFEIKVKIKLSNMYAYVNLLHYTLLTLKDDSTSGGLYLFHLFYMLSMIIISDSICTRVHLYTKVICTDGTIMNMCLCLLVVLLV